MKWGKAAISPAASGGIRDVLSPVRRALSPVESNRSPIILLEPRTPKTPFEGRTPLERFTALSSKLKVCKHRDSFYFCCPWRCFYAVGTYLMCSYIFVVNWGCFVLWQDSLVQEYLEFLNTASKYVNRSHHFFFLLGGTFYSSENLSNWSVWCFKS